MPLVAGRGTITVRRTGQRRIRFKRVVRRTRGTRLRILATGDSMIQIVDSFMKQRLNPLPGVGVRSDAHISTGISKAFLFDWNAHARRTARSYRPDVTVMFIGANDGFPIRLDPLLRRGVDARVCAPGRPDDVRLHARRPRARLLGHAAGAGRGIFKAPYRAVNRAVRSAAARTAGKVRVLDFEKIYTPRGVFQQSIRFRGRSYSVRQGDKVHLNTTGARIGATLISEAIARDGLLGP